MCHSCVNYPSDRQKLQGHGHEAIAVHDVLVHFLASANITMLGSADTDNMASFLTLQEIVTLLQTLLMDEVKAEVVIVVVAMSREQRGGRSELVFSFHLLLCCVEYVIRLTPSFQLKPPFGTSFIARCIAVYPL